MTAPVCAFCGSGRPLYDGCPACGAAWPAKRLEADMMNGHAGWDCDESGCPGCDEERDA